jgi:tetratricopeptide (TPR) repeat protein
MIEAPCAACGTVNRMAESELPAGAKFVTCSSCKSRVALPAQRGAPPGAKPGAPPPIPKAPPIPSKAPTVDLADLPAPKRSSALAGAGDARPAPKSGLAAFEADLPAPKSAKASSPLAFDDLLPSPEPEAELPAPKPKTPPARPTPVPQVGITDLPAPARTKDAGTGRVKIPPREAPPIVDLPAPKSKAPPIVDLPTPKHGIVDLPMPKDGGFSDLPMPKPGGPGDLPAPKGFFDDLPQPAKKGGGGVDLPAPKGFFDDLPQPAKPSVSDVPAPKGFFDDLPQPAKGGRPAPAAGANQGGLFDDLPKPAQGRSNEPMDPTALDLDLGPSSAGNQSFSLDGPGLDLDSSKPTGGSGAFDLDLSEPIKPEIKISTPEGMKLKTPTKGAGPKSLTPLSTLPAEKGGKGGGELKLELEDGAKASPAAVAQATKVAKKQKVDGASAEAKAASARRTRIALGVFLAVAALGAGGFYMYQRHSKAKDREGQIESSIAEARAALAAADKNHWSHAASAAEAALELDASNAQALGINAEASLAGALDNGVNAPAKIAASRRMIGDAVAAGHAGPELEHAQALAAIAGGNADPAIAKLTPLLAKEPKNGFLLLYMGWAQLQKGDGKAALDAFGNAVAASPAVKLPALYGHGRAKLLLADPAGARTDFTAVLETDKDHIGAQVGLAETLPPQQASQRESDLLAVLARKDLDKADPRAVVRAWSLAADVARLGGRLDVARERYHKALVLAPTDTAALTGAASVELRDGKIAIAQEFVQKAIGQAKDEPSVQLALAELDIRQGKLPDAIAGIKALDNRTPALPPLLHAQLQVVKGKLFEAQGDDLEAIGAYEQGAKDAGDLDLAPTMAAVEKLGVLAKKAIDAKDDKRAAGYRERADKLLSSLAERAQDDAMLSMTLGVAYLQAGDPSKAEGLLRRATEMRVTDVEPKIELAKALSRQGKTDESLEQLRKAFSLEPTRLDLVLELARTYEQAGRDDEAGKAYESLLQNKDATVPARVHAGRFFAKHGDIKRAAEQGDIILAAEPDNAAGHYLKGEGLLAAGPTRLDDARKELALAVDADPEAQYLDAQGRAAEKTVELNGEIKFYDLALRAYSRATDNDPKQFNSWAGQGRVHVARKEWDLAAKPLAEANKLNPKDPDVMFNLGLTAAKLGGDANKRAAVAWLVKSSLIKPQAETSHQLGMLYDDLNQVAFAVKAWDSATKLAAEVEKQTGKPVEWLTEAYYQLGNDIEITHTDCHGQRDAWEHYVSRNPKPGARLDGARRALATSLKTC